MDPRPHTNTAAKDLADGVARTQAWLTALAAYLADLASPEANPSPKSQ